MDSTAPSPPKRGWPTIVAALAVTAIVVASLLISARGRLSTTLGDTDDAMRLVMVRDLMSGVTGWFTPHMTRVQPPLGLDMHWSRLVDGGLAAMDWAFRLVMSPDQAETATRMAWPLLWTFPAIWAALALSRRLGGTAALLPAAALLMTNILHYAQWWPGRIDHHDIQITMALAAAVGAAEGGIGGALLTGVASAFGLAVGIEVLPFAALAGACFAFRFLLDPERARPAQAYAAMLVAATSIFYVLQTPPARLALTACDEIGANLWAGVGVAGIGLILAVEATRRRGPVLRWAALGVAGVLAGAAYLGLDPACLRGPAGHVDPRIRPIWLDFVTEMYPLLDKFWTTRSNFIVCCLVFMALGALSWIWLGARKEGRTAQWLIVGGFFALSAALGFSAQRMIHYSNWFAVPLMAAALGDITQRYFKGSLVPPVVAAAIICQPAQIWLLGVIPGWEKAKSKSEAAADRCIEQAAMRPLSHLPAGLVLGEIDLGPRILAQTPHSVVAAPYHRLAWGILAANDALSATPGKDERAVRALKAQYIVTCPARIGQMNHAGLGRQSLQVRLDHAETPSWLERLSPPAAPLQIYRVKAAP